MGKMLLRSAANSVSTRTVADSYYHLSCAGIVPLNAGFEQNTQIKSYTALVFSRFGVRVNLNSNDQTMTAWLRKNAGNGNQFASVGAGLTGVFVDIANTDSIVSDDLVNAYVQAAGTISFRINAIFCGSENTGGNENLICGGRVGSSLDSTLYYPLNGHGWNASSTLVDYIIRAAATVGKTGIRVNSNVSTIDRMFRSFKNGANGNIAITVTALTTGVFEDLGHSDSLSVGDTFCWVRLWVGGVGTHYVDLIFCAYSSDNIPYTTGFEPSTFSAVNYFPMDRLTNLNTVEASTQIPAPFAMQFTNLQVRINSGSLNVNTMTFRKNGAPTALAVLLPNTGLSPLDTDAVSVAKGALITFEFTFVSGNNSVIWLHIDSIEALPAGGVKKSAAISLLGAGVL